MGEVFSSFFTSFLHSAFVTLLWHSLLVIASYGIGHRVYGKMARLIEERAKQ